MSADETQLDDVLRLTTQRFLERRLQTRVFKMNYAKSVHHARTLIYQRHIRVGKQLVNQANFLVRGDSESHIDFALASPYNTATGTPGRVGEFAGGLFGMGFIAKLLPPPLSLSFFPTPSTFCSAPEGEDGGCGVHGRGVTLFVDVLQAAAPRAGGEGGECVPCGACAHNSAAVTAAACARRRQRACRLAAAATRPPRRR